MWWWIRSVGDTRTGTGVGPSFEDLPVLKGTYARRSFTPDLGRDPAAERQLQGFSRRVMVTEPSSVAVAAEAVSQGWKRSGSSSPGSAVQTQQMYRARLSSSQGVGGPGGGSLAVLLAAGGGGGGG